MSEGLPPADDREPIVVLDDDMTAMDVLGADEMRSLSPVNKAYLQSVGVTDPKTWEAFRLGQVTQGDILRLGLVGQSKPHSQSILWPTYDPRDCERVQGLVLLSPAQHKHRVAERSAGLGCPRDIDNNGRIIICDTPLTVLRLYQYGIRNVVLCESPHLLDPFAPWLTRREVIVFTHKLPGMKRLTARLMALKVDHCAARICSNLEHSRDQLQEVLKTNEEKASLNSLLSELCSYGKRCVSNEDGMTQIRELGLANPDLFRAYTPGYFPIGFRDVWPEHQKSLLPQLKAGCLMLPAFDPAGVVVDMMMIWQQAKRIQYSLWDTPRGLLAPVLTTAYEELCVTDTIGRLGRLFCRRPTLLLRGREDAAANAQRLAQAGVKRVEVHSYRNAEAIAESLRAAGITVTIRTEDMLAQDPNRQPIPFTVPEELAQVLTPTVEPAPIPEPAADPDAVRDSLPAALELVRNDATQELAIYRWAEVEFAVQVPWSAAVTSLEVKVSHSQAWHRDRLDLSSEAQRQRFAQSAGARLGLPPSRIVQALVLILPAVQSLVAPVTPAPAPEVPAASLSSPDREATLDLLRIPDLLGRWSSDLDALGWVGEPEAKSLVLLAAISRLCPEPLWMVQTATHAGERFPALGILAAMTPPEHLIQVSRLSDSALFHAESLRHKLLIIDDLASLGPAAATALKVMHSRGCLTSTQVEREAIRGEMRTRFVACQGPLAVVSASVGQVPEALRLHLLEVPMDESLAQAERILAARRRALAVPHADPQRRLEAWRNAQRLLAALPVIIPQSADFSMPPGLGHQRSLSEAFLALIQASAILHQYQRPRLDGHAVASIQDHALAIRLIATLAAVRQGDLTTRGQRLLTVLRATGTTSFGMQDVANAIPDWPRTTIRRAIDDLIKAEYVVGVHGRQGQSRSYLFQEPGQIDQLGHLATLGHLGWPGVKREVVNG